MRYLEKAQALMYDKMGIHEFETEVSAITLSDLDGITLGTSGGLEPPDGTRIKLPSGESVKVSASGLKITKLESDLENVLNFLEHGEEFLVSYSNTLKDEVFHSGGSKQKDDVQWSEFLDKVRVFTVPNSPLLIANRLVTRIRHMKERGLICIGHKWNKGGWDRLARILGVTREMAFWLILVEGDIIKLDQSIYAVFVKIYYSWGLVHEIQGSIAYAMKKMLLGFVCKNVVTRLTRVFCDLWEILYGKVPSGILDTSHMDSYVKLLWFFLFCVHTISMAPKDKRRGLTDYLAAIIIMIVYGDDFLYNKGNHAEYSVYFSGQAYSDWLKKYLDVGMRDLRDGASLCSLHHNGWFTHKGASFLKMYCVLNEMWTKTNGQCIFLPFRETREYVMRCFNGREPKNRDILDMLLSSIAHAYGTYGSNMDAYLWLMSFYESLIYENKLLEVSAIDDVVARLSAKDLKQYRMLGMDLDDIKSGFPTVRTLREKNIWDENYHSITSYEMTSSYEADWAYD